MKTKSKAQQGPTQTQGKELRVNIHPLAEITSAESFSDTRARVAEEMRSLSVIFESTTYCDELLIERVGRLNMRLGELYFNATRNDVSIIEKGYFRSSKKKTLTDDELKISTTLSQAMSILGDIVRNRRPSKTSASYLRNLSDSLDEKQEPIETSGGKAENTQNIEGEWSKPTTKSTMKNALRIDGDKVFNTFAKQHSIRQAGNRQLWQIRLDTMDNTTRKKLEKL